MVFPGKAEGGSIVVDAPEFVKIKRAGMFRLGSIAHVPCWATDTPTASSRWEGGAVLVRRRCSAQEGVYNTPNPRRGSSIGDQEGWARGGLVPIGLVRRVQLVIVEEVGILWHGQDQFRILLVGSTLILVIRVLATLIIFLSINTAAGNIAGLALERGGGRYRARPDAPSTHGFPACGRSISTDIGTSSPSLSSKCIDNITPFGSDASEVGSSPSRRSLAAAVENEGEGSHPEGRARSAHVKR
eukprot:CAMPEP_0194329924 /NCGR_PEP_ID=MMETSP0171-20130528/49788_1 /TAXON_ID=218684 /ORGANISM="Corethron pennatum, Strain L29A3" /LENGTH=242 /DNA_ID=CAMNT_0039090799 /DNA_START=678 /DNA_END=1407 /DNA_ORIENTATION=-